jgi:hypothetical protein
VKKRYLFILFSFFIFSTCFSNNKHKKEPELLKIFKEAYPQVDFKSEYDSNLNDWKIIITTNNKSEILYWADGKFLPVDELKNKDLYSPFLYNYPKEIPNPQNFTEEDITRIKEFSNPKNRTEGKGTPQFLYNLIYNVETRVSTESHIKRHSFLGKNTNAHDMIHEKLDLVQADILNAAKKDTETKEFLEKNGVAIWIKKDDNIEDELYKILNSQEKLQSMKVNARLLAKKNSTKDICEILLGKL